MCKQYGLVKWIRLQSSHRRPSRRRRTTTPDDDVAIGDVRNGEWVVGIRDGVRQTHETGVPGGVRGTKSVAHARVIRIDYGVFVGIRSR